MADDGDDDDEDRTEKKNVKQELELDCSIDIYCMYITGQNWGEGGRGGKGYSLDRIYYLSGRSLMNGTNPPGSITLNSQGKVGT
jgi:hypothetical protein